MPRLSLESPRDALHVLKADITLGHDEVPQVLTERQIVAAQVAPSEFDFLTRSRYRVPAGEGGANRLGEHGAHGSSEVRDQQVDTLVVDGLVL